MGEFKVTDCFLIKCLGPKVISCSPSWKLKFSKEKYGLPDSLAYKVGVIFLDVCVLIVDIFLCTGKF